MRPFILLLVWIHASILLAQTRDAVIRIGMIGLDTSHSIAFTKLINGSEDEALAGMRVVAAYPHGSRDIESSASRIPKYTAEMKEMGIVITQDLPSLIDQVDAVLLETNDGRPHLEQVVPVLKAGKPCFIDKPIAGSLVDCLAIFQLAKHYDVPIFSSSSLRYGKATQAARNGSLGNITGCSTWSPCSLEKTHPDLFWYGIHGVESLFTVMGPGVETVTRIQTEQYELVSGVWEDGRIGTFRGLRGGKSGYGGTAFGSSGIGSVGGSDGYVPLVIEIAKFFRTGAVPVSPEETIAIYAFMDAADESKREGFVPVSVKTVIEKAATEAAPKVAALIAAPLGCVAQQLEICRESAAMIMDVPCGVKVRIRLMSRDVGQRFPVPKVEVKARTSLLLLFVFYVVASTDGFGQSSENEFFESKIRPLLAERCFSCHSAMAEKLQAGLYLDRADGVTKGGDSGPTVVPGKPDESMLIRAIRYEEYEMPPDRKLADMEIELLTRWVEMGAPWPADDTGVSDTVHGEYDWDRFRTEHWSFRPVKHPDPPAVKDTDWTIGTLDHFILAPLEEAGLRAGPPTAPRDLVRRIYFDLIGLPPTPDEVHTFVSAAAQDRQAAVIDLVNQLLDTPLYGERWGRHWLDVARFSDGLGGFSNPRANKAAWRYRDWVVTAFNQDMPYDDFVKLQIAGDLLGDHGTPVATGFFALGPEYKSDGGDPDSVAQAKGETLDDRVDTLSRGLLGLTASCARCHDHKFDPIPQQDYYSLAGIFNNVGIHDVPLAPQETVTAWDQQSKAIADLKSRIKGLNREVRKKKRELTDDEKKQKGKLETQLEQLQESLPPKYPSAHALHDTGSENMNVAIRGNLRKKGDEAPRRFLRILAGDHRTEFTNGSGRLELADAIVDPANPLTARVVVNRIWMHHFGKALVRSPSNFGVFGEEPTHPQLLDWLASEFIKSGWSIKSLHRKIIMSAAYQQSSATDAHNFEADGDNRLVWRMNPRRMDVEVWRDSILFVTDELDLTRGGPPFDDLSKTNRRTLYAKVSRSGDQVAADGFLRLFDFPLMRATIAKRPQSIVPQQFLFMMNSDFMVARAQAFARRLEMADHNREAWIRQTYRLLFGRAPHPDEISIGLEFMAPRTGAGAGQDGNLSKLVQYSQALLSSNEFMYVR